MSLILFNQTLTMLLLMAVGYFLIRIGMIDDAFTKRLGKVLIEVIVPCMTVQSFMTPPEGASLSMLGEALVVSTIIMVVAVGLGYAVFGRSRGVDSFAMSFSNAGFFGIPVVTAMYGNEAMFYIAAMLLVFNVIVFTYGVWIMTGNDEVMSVKAIYTNPVVISAIIGLLIFVASIPIPGVVVHALELLANTNTPLAMMILGSYLAKVRLKDLFTNTTLIAPIAGRLVGVPVVTAIVLRILGFELTPLVGSLFAACSAPVAANTALFSQQYDLDEARAIELVCLSTILSVVTLPLVFHFAEWLM